MGVIKVKRSEVLGMEVRLEQFNSGWDMINCSAKRPILPSFINEGDRRKPGTIESDHHFFGVRNFQEAEDLMLNGYQPVVEKMKENEKKFNISGQGKRYRPTTEVYGFAPVVPLALMGVPECMMNQKMTKIKAKVLNVYYDIGVTASYGAEKIAKAGNKLLGAIMELEMQGYRFNLYVAKSQCDGRGDSDGVDMTTFKIKDSNTPLDLKRMSFPLAHAAFFRVFCHDWYMRFPKAHYRWGLGRSITYDYNEKELADAFEELFGEKCVVFGASKLLDDSAEHIKKVLKGEME